MRFAKDSWFSVERTFSEKGLFRYDKIQHLVGGFILGLVFNIYWASSFNVLWEVKDGFLPYEKIGFLGGDGFSWKDASATQFGIMIGYGFKQLFVEIGIA